MLSLGIVGLPNVGKSTLFNALTHSKQADAQNYPFCTIEPNIGVVEVPDERLEKLSRVSKSEKTIPTAIEFVDIAGLVKGASGGEGLGNKFLSHIREVDAIIQVVRVFNDANVAHVHNKIDPKEDADIINLELVMADWQTVSNRLEKTKKTSKGAAAKEVAKEIKLLERVFKQLEEGKSARELDYSEDDSEIVKELHLLTMKPLMYVFNTDEGTEADQLVEDLEEGAVTISAKLEAEVAELDSDEAKKYLQELGIGQTGLDKLVIAGYKLLDLVTYFTSGEPETRAWTVNRGTKGPEAAGVIHTDFTKGYIKAEVAKWEDFVEQNGWNGVKETGKMKLEGKEYVVEDGDVCYFHVSA